jgi:hypothetical protein
MRRDDAMSSSWTRALPYLLWAATVGAGGAWLHARDSRDRARDDEARVVSAQLARLASAVEAQGQAQAQQSAAPTLDPALLEAFARAAEDRAAAAQAHPPAPVAPPTPVTPPTPAQQAASDDARRLVDGVLERRRVTAADVTALRADFALADPEGVQEARRQIVVALNDGRLTPEEHPFLLP